MGKLKDKLNKNVTQEYTLTEQEFNYLANLEGLKNHMKNEIDLYMASSQHGFMTYLANEKAGVKQGISLNFDIDFKDKSRKLKIIENKDDF